jgi:hypothetical protein
LTDKEDEKCPLYIANNTFADTKISPSPKSNEHNIFEPEEHDINPLIFYRLQRPLKDKMSLPSLALEKFFVSTDHHGFKVTVIPDYSFEKSKKMINIQKDKYKKTVDSIKKFDEKLDSDLLEAIENRINVSGIDFYNNPSSEINASDCEFTTRELKAKSAKEIQPRLNAFLSFNENFATVIPFVILDEEMIKEVTGGKSEIKADTLSALFLTCKSIAFRCTKNSYIK